jgi:DNA-binding transcriptional ArsR family regulator
MKRRSNPTGHPIRVTILELLDEDEMTMFELRRELPGEPTIGTIGYHLAVLQEADLVDREDGIFRRAA